jgi:hypothetical protein
MTTESAARVLGAIVGAAVLVMAIVYGPIGQLGKPQKKTEQPALIAPSAANAPPAVRGPVVREVPQ